MNLFGTMKVNENCLEVGEIRYSKLAETFGTPLYVLDEKLIRDNCKKFKNTFESSTLKTDVIYAGKAFLSLAMCGIIQDEGLSLDVVSGGELYTAYKSEFNMDNVYFHGNNKTLEEIEMGVKLGVGIFVVDNMFELERLDEVGRNYNKVQNIYIRITPGIEAHTHDYIKTGALDSKFGFPLIEDNIIKVIKKIKEMRNIKLCGLHCHIGSQIFDTTPYKDEVKIMIELLKDIYNQTGFKIDELNLGGGFGIYYSENDEPKTIEEYCETIIKSVEQSCEESSFKISKVCIEPGRSIIGNAGSTLYKVGAIKEIKNIAKYVLVDGGMTDNIRPALYQARYNCALVNKIDENIEESVTVCGRCCESGDILIKDVRLPYIEIDDLLLVFSTGAYTYSMSNNYNKIGKSAVILVKNGEAKIICKRQTYEDIILNEL